MGRTIITYGKYFVDFYKKLDAQVQEKIEWVMELVKTAERIPKKYFDHLTNTDGLFEIRVEYKSNIYRIICFFDKDNLVVLINSFQKKTQKTPANEIKLAEGLKKQYFIDKKIDQKNESSSTKVKK